MKSLHTAVFCLFLVLPITILAQSPTSSPAHSLREKTRVYFKSPQDGAAVKRRFRVEFGVTGMEVKPAGTMTKATGHHHIIINGKAIKKGELIPADDKHLHFGLGQSETELELPAGQHFLTLQFADGSHISYGDDLSATISVNVIED